MKNWVMLLSLLALALPMTSHAKGCDDLKAEIDARIRANKVTHFTLEVLPAGDSSSGKTVGTCEGGKKKIVYSRG
jgi:hypothetical protein